MVEVDEFGVGTYVSRNVEISCCASKGWSTLASEPRIEAKQGKKAHLLGRGGFQQRLVPPRGAQARDPVTHTALLDQSLLLQTRADGALDEENVLIPRIGG